LHNDDKTGDDQRKKSEVRRLFVEGQLDPNAATARLLEVDRRRRQSEPGKPRR
jgi:hypothetical protein